METFRLNNPVTTTFRTLLQDYTFDAPNPNPNPNFNSNPNSYSYPKGSSFLILNNPVLRDSECFERPDTYDPERWIEHPELEQSYYSMMFNQGPQKCPGKNLSLMIMMITYQQFMKKAEGQELTIQPKLNQSKIKQMINPYRIKIYVKN